MSATDRPQPTSVPLEQWMAQCVQDRPAAGIALREATQNQMLQELVARRALAGEPFGIMFGSAAPLPPAERQPGREWQIYTTQGGSVQWRRQVILALARQLELHMREAPP